MKRQKKKRGNLQLPENTVTTVAYVAALLALLRRIWLNGIYGQDGSAYYAVAFDWFFLLAAPLAAGLYEAVSTLAASRIERGRGKDARRAVTTALGAGLLSSLVLGGLCFLGADFLAERLLHLRLMSMSLQMMLPALVFIVIAAVLCGGMDGFGSLSAAAVSRILFFAALFLGGPLLAGPLMNYGIKVGALLREAQYGPAYGALGAAVSVLAAALIWAVVSVFAWILHKPMLREQAEFSQMSLSEGKFSMLLSLIGQAIPVFATLLFLALSGLMQTVFYLKGQGNGETLPLSGWGAYAGCIRPLLALPAFLLLSFAQHIIPGVQVGFAQRNLKRCRERCMISLRCCTLLSFPFAAFFCVMAGPILAALMPSVQPGPLLSVLRLGGLCLIPFGLAAVWGAILLGMDRTLSFLIGLAAAFVMHLAVLRVLLGTLGMDLSGVVCANLVLFVLLCLIFGFCALRLGRIQVNWIRILLAPLVGSVVMAGVCALFGLVILSAAPAGLNVAVCAVIGILAYFVTVVVLQGATEREMEAFPCGDVLVAFARMLRIMR